MTNVCGTTIPTDITYLDKFGKHWPDDMKCSMEHVTSTISCNEMEATLKGLEGAKSPGPDRLPAWLFKRFAKQLAPFLVNLMNGILKGDKMPECFKGQSFCGTFAGNLPFFVSSYDTILLVTNYRLVWKPIILCGFHFTTPTLQNVSLAKITTRPDDG